MHSKQKTFLFVRTLIVSYRYIIAVSLKADLLENNEKKNNGSYDFTSNLDPIHTLQTFC